MEKRKIERISLAAIVVVLLSIPLYKFVRAYRPLPTQADMEASYVGRDACVECHRNEFNDWVGSPHDKAMDVANDSTVLGDFNNRSIEYNGMLHRMYKRNGHFYVETDGKSGKLEEFEIKYTFGYFPLQQYLVEFEKGKLQTLPITWDSKDHKWYHMASQVYKNEIIKSDNWLHWTNQAQNWNSMCADCHSTNLVKGYDLETDSYHTTWSEIDVSCEACHGPASKHLEWAAKGEYARETNNNYGLVAKTSGIDNKQYVDLCVRCHSRRTALSDFDHSADLYNHSVPALPMEPEWHIDGQIKDEDYVYASFTQSKMYMRNVKCNDCHNVHSTKRHFDDNRLCTQCHRADDYDTYNHHFHKSAGASGNAVIANDGVKFDVGSGTLCANCHMPAQFYMGVDYRNDHSFRAPRPDLTQKLGVPNACNQCHADKSPQWAVDYVNKWHGVGRHAQYGVAFDEAQKGTKQGYDGLVRIYQDEAFPEIIRATAIRMMGMHYKSKAKNILIEATRHLNGHIRYNALLALNIDGEKSLEAVLQLLNDGTKAIRIECALKLSGINPSQVPEKYKDLLAKANAEYMASLYYNADFPTGKLNLANYHYNNNDIDKAETIYLKSLEQDKELHSIKVNLAILYNRKGDFVNAERYFKDYLQHEPENGETTFNYALFLSEQKRYDESMDYLLKASKLSPENPRIKYNIAMMYDFRDEFGKAEEYLKETIRINPNDPAFQVALLNLYVKNQKNSLARQQAQTILNKFPDIPDKQAIQALLE